MEDPQDSQAPQMSRSWQDSGDVLQGIMVGPDTHTIPSHLSMGDSSSNPLLDLHLNTDLSLENHPHPHDQSFLGPWSSSTESQNFYYPYPARLSAGQDAWNPLQVTGVPPSQPSMSHLNDDYHAFRKPHYRTPSDSGSQYMGSLISGDSGYVSNTGAPQSVAYGMDSSPHMSSKENGSTMFSEALAMYDQPQMGSGNIFMKDFGDCASISTESVKCEHPACSWVGKCPSDKRKHEARHRKSFKCDEPNCPRKEGFGTINDLARHKKCVHNKEPERGPKMMYLCFGKSCPRPNKRWPRLDNFKQHLSRMHHEEDADALLKKSMDWYESVTGHRGQKLEDGSLEDSMMDIQQDMMSTHSGDLDIDTTESVYCSQETLDFVPSREPTPKPQSSTTLQVPPTNSSQQLNALGLSPTLTNSSHDVSVSVSTSIERIPPSETFVADAADNLITAMTKKMNRPRKDTDEGIDLEENQNLSPPQRQMLQKVLLAALDRLSDDPQAQPTTPTPALSFALASTPTPALPPTSTSAPESKGGFQCTICPKRTRLRCEMKKHQKRHERPYGCTFPHCTKSFGSKADWKRHESSQHLHIASWLCPCPSQETISPNASTNASGSSAGGSCGRIFYREETYLQHLGHIHRLSKNKIRNVLNGSRLDLSGQNGFWCGFCERVLESECPGGASGAVGLLDERFNHIDVEHFKKGERGVNWKFPGQGIHFTGEGEADGERRKRRCLGL